MSKDVLSSSRTSFFPGRIQGEEEYDELRGGGDRWLVFRGLTTEHGICVGSSCCIGGANPVIFVVDMTLVAVHGGVGVSSTFTWHKGERRCFALGIEGVDTEDEYTVSVDVGCVRLSE